MKIAKNIKRRRKQLDMSLRELEAASGVSNPFLSQVENGNNVSLKTLERIAKGLRCTVQELMK